MRKLVRSIRALLALSVAVSLIVATPGPVAAAYYGDCASPDVFYHWYESRDFTETAYFVKGVIGDVTVRPLHSCTGRVASSIVIPTTIQKWNDGGGGLLVQLGYWDGDSSGAPQASFTSSDAEGGMMYTACWYGASCGLLTIGQYYRFYIIAATDGSNHPIWNMCIRNVTQGENCGGTYSPWHSIPRTWGTPGGNLPWWGYENHNTNDTLGPREIDGRVHLHYAQYLTTQSGAQWTVAQPLHCLQLNAPGSVPRFNHCSVSTTVYAGDTLDTFTSSQ